MIINSKENQQTDSEYSNLRLWPRYHVDVRVIAIMRDGDKTTRIYGRGTDMSICGMAVYIASELAVGTEVELELMPPYVSKPINVTAAVRNRSGFCYGVEFTLITKAQQALIDRACQALALLQ